MRKILILFTLSAALSVYPQTLNKIIARVNNDVITTKDIDSYSQGMPEGADIADLREQILTHPGKADCPGRKEG